MKLMACACRQPGTKPKFCCGGLDDRQHVGGKQQQDADGGRSNLHRLADLARGDLGKKTVLHVSKISWRAPHQAQGRRARFADKQILT